MTQTTQMKKYFETRMVKAKPMTRGSYNGYRGWTLPADESPDDDGYLVEYLDVGIANDVRHAGYISWSPAEVFERAYHTVEGMSFSQALGAMKAGAKVQRTGWNGKGMFLYLVPEGRYAPATSAAREIAREQPDGRVPYGAYIAMKTAQGNVVPWLASQTDVLSEDWQVI